MKALLRRLYKQKKNEISQRLEEFRQVWWQEDNKIFAELCFCICTPQSKAENCDEVIRKLEKNRLLFNGSEEKIRPYLKKTRFYKNKSRYIVEARSLFRKNGSIKLKNKLGVNSVSIDRDWLAKNVKGIGYKEASHFLRNIGFGENLAILDVHILKNLKKCGVIQNVPKSMTKKEYLNIEEEFKKFSKKIKIPIAHLDLLFWSKETGKIFK